jgi:hypothetical protein
MVQGFWENVLPLVAERLHEFSFSDLIKVLESASKPYVGKKSVIKILAGFAVQALNILEERTQLPSTYLEDLNTLEELIPILFPKQELQAAILQRLSHVANNVRMQT